MADSTAFGHLGTASNAGDAEQSLLALTCAAAAVGLRFFSTQGGKAAGGGLAAMRNAIGKTKLLTANDKMTSKVGRE